MEDHELIKAIICSIQQGTRWLKAKSDNLYDVRQIALTLQALYAAERRKYSNTLTRLINKLVRMQDDDGSWNQELYDSAFAALALHDVRKTSETQALSKVLAFAERIKDDRCGNWYEEPFETMLAAEMCLKLKRKTLYPLIRRSIAWIIEFQHPTGMWLGARYTGMAISFLIRAQKALNSDYHQNIQKGVQWLRQSILRKGIWTSAAWSNSYALNGLLDANLTLDDPAVRSAVQWFLDTQGTDGQWPHVAPVADTALAVLVLSRFLKAPIVDIVTPKLGKLVATRQDSVLEIRVEHPNAGALLFSERIKIAEPERNKIAQELCAILEESPNYRSHEKVTHSRRIQPLPRPFMKSLIALGNFAYQYLFTKSVRDQLTAMNADHLLLDLDEKLIDLPWELLYDDNSFLCLRFAMGRRIATRELPPRRTARTKKCREIRMLIVADPTGDLPQARQEGRLVSQLAKKRRVYVKTLVANQATRTAFLKALSQYDIVHYAGHANYQRANPDQSYLKLRDGRVTAFEIERFTGPELPSVVFLNACWSAKELATPASYQSIVRGLSRTFLYSGVNTFLGSLLPIPDASAARMAVLFYEGLFAGYSVGEALRMARSTFVNESDPNDSAWATLLLYGDPTSRPIQVAL